MPTWLPTYLGVHTYTETLSVLRSPYTDLMRHSTRAQVRPRAQKLLEEEQLGETITPVQVRSTYVCQMDGRMGDERTDGRT